MRYTGKSERRAKRKLHSQFSKKAKTKEMLIQHTQKRFRERYRKIYTREDIDTLVRLIQVSASCVKSLGKQSHNKSIFNISYDDNIYPVVYDNRRHTIATVLPQNHSWLSHEEVLQIIDNKGH